MDFILQQLELFPPTQRVLVTLLLIGTMWAGAAAGVGFAGWLLRGRRARQANEGSMK